MCKKKELFFLALYIKCMFAYMYICIQNIVINYVFLHTLLDDLVRHFMLNMYSNSA